jgi:hypothetical protein
MTQRGSAKCAKQAPSAADVPQAVEGMIVGIWSANREFMHLPRVPQSSAMEYRFDRTEAVVVALGRSIIHRT